MNVCHVILLTLQFKNMLVYERIILQGVISVVWNKIFQRLLVVLSITQCCISSSRHQRIYQHITLHFEYYLHAVLSMGSTERKWNIFYVTQQYRLSQGLSQFYWHNVWYEHILPQKQISTLGMTIITMCLCAEPRGIHLREMFKWAQESVNPGFYLRIYSILFTKIALVESLDLLIQRFLFLSKAFWLEGSGNTNDHWLIVCVI